MADLLSHAVSCSLALSLSGTGSVCDPKSAFAGHALSARSQQTLVTSDEHSLCLRAETNKLAVHEYRGQGNAWPQPRLTRVTGGGGAQLVERRTRYSKTRGSNPVRSTRQICEGQFFRVKIVVLTRRCAQPPAVCIRMHTNNHIRMLKIP